MRRSALLVISALLFLPLAACGGNHDSPGPLATSDSAGTLAPRTFVDDLLTAIDAKHSVHLTVDAKAFGAGKADVSYGHGPTVIRVDGDLNNEGAERFVITDGVVYVQQGDGGQFMKIDGTDPSYGQLLSTFTGIGPHESIAGLGKGINSVVAAGSKTVAGEKLFRYKISANPSTATGAFRALAGSSNIAGDLMFDFYVDNHDLLREIDTTVNGQAVTVTLSDWGKPVSINVPSGEELAKN